MVDVIVLAGGYSSRADTNKMTLEYQGKPLIMNVIETAHSVSDNIIVVTGHYHKELSSLLKGIPYVKVVYNDDYSSGMFSSIKAGVLNVEQDFLIVPGDYPTISADTYKKILLAKGNIRVPSCCHRLGHPIFFKQVYRKLILETDFTNLKDFRNSQEYAIVDVEDIGVITDIDNQDDYKKLLGKD